MAGNGAACKYSVGAIQVFYRLFEKNCSPNGADETKK